MLLLLFCWLLVVVLFCCSVVLLSEKRSWQRGAASGDERAVQEHGGLLGGGAGLLAAGIRPGLWRALLRLCGPGRVLSDRHCARRARLRLLSVLLLRHHRHHHLGRHRGPHARAGLSHLHSLCRRAPASSRRPLDLGSLRLPQVRRPQRRFRFGFLLFVLLVVVLF